MLFKLKILNKIYINDAKLWKKNIYTIWDYEDIIKTDNFVTIRYLNTEKEEIKEHLKEVSDLLSESQQVMLREYTPEKGGAGGPGITGKEIFDYIVRLKDDPLVLIGISFAGEKLMNAILDTVKAFNTELKKKNFRYVIRFTMDKARINFVFDNLKAETAIRASKRIPSNVSSISSEIDVNDDIYYVYNSKKDKWSRLIPEKL
jgi:hypothetical protein